MVHGAVVAFDERPECFAPSGESRRNQFAFVGSARRDRHGAGRLLRNRAYHARTYGRVTAEVSKNAQPADAKHWEPGAVCETSDRNHIPGGEEYSVIMQPAFGEGV